jgi:hypothetical protein
MNKIKIIGCLLFLVSCCVVSTGAENQFDYKGQLSAWGLFNPSADQSLWFGGRYIPQANYEINLPGNHLIDFEASANLFGSTAITPFTSVEYGGKIKPYRVWVRYSAPQLEIRAGLQKINFGSASMLRPLMWFDQIDPRDPLKLTDGVWGVLGRYYFLNNANIWLWGLYGNNDLKGWELTKTEKWIPEFGGRFQFPFQMGEAAITYHHREINTSGLEYLIPEVVNNVPENRLGVDLRLDWVTGLWLEGTWVKKEAELNQLTNQHVFNAGIDYTFGIGNGIYAAFEQLLFSYDSTPFAFNGPVTFSLMSLSYPIGLFDQISAIFYYDWTNENLYSFLNYQLQFQQLTLYIMGFWNPETFNVPTQNTSANLFGGKGLQLMLVWNH